MVGIGGAYQVVAYAGIGVDGIGLGDDIEVAALGKEQAGMHEELYMPTLAASDLSHALRDRTRFFHDLPSRALGCDRPPRSPCA